MQLANQHLDSPQHRAGAERHPVTQEQAVVGVLDADARELAHDVDRLEHLAQIHHPHLPRIAILREHRMQRGRARAMSSARIEVDQIDIARRRARAHRRELKSIRFRAEQLPRWIETTHRVTFTSVSVPSHRSSRSTPLISSTSAVRLWTQSPSLM